MLMNNIALFHLLFVVPYFLYLWYNYPNFNPINYYILMILGLIIVVYHTYAYKNPFNLMHILLGITLIWFGYTRDNMNKYYYDFFLIFAIAAGGYHGYSILSSY